MNEIGIDRFRIELIEDYPCEDKYQLRQREGHYIREIGTLNMMVAGRTDIEWHKETYEEKKEEILKKKKIYHTENRDKILQYQKEFRKNNPEIAKLRDEQRYLKFKETILSQNKEKLYVNVDVKLQKEHYTTIKKLKNTLIYLINNSLSNELQKRLFFLVLSIINAPY